MTDSLSSRGFVRVDCSQCKNPDVWFKCDSCTKSDHFLVTDGMASCDCGATYDRGTCTCGNTVPSEGLVFVRFEEGPMALAELEIAWGRVAALGGVALAALGGVAWMIWV